MDNGKWKLSTPLNNLLENSSLEAPANMYELAEPASMYDIGQSGTAFIAQDPDHTRPELNGTCAVYYVPVTSYAAKSTAVPVKTQTPDLDKAFAAQNVKISPDGKCIAFLYVPFSCPANTILVLGYVTTMVAFDAYEKIIGEAPRLPLNDFEWAGTSDSIICTADDCGRSRLSLLKLKQGFKGHTLLHDGTISAYHPLKPGNFEKVLVSSTNFVDNSLWQIIDTSGRDPPKLVSSATKHGAKLGLSRSMVDEFWYEGEDDIPVHCFIVKPRDFDQSKQYPWILAVHGGPQGAWNDAWSSRWNMALIAQQGYVVICPNIAGSMGYGVPFAARMLPGLPLFASSGH